MQRLWGELARKHVTRYARDADELANGVGLRGDAALASAVYARVQAKLQREPIEDFRIDFEDGFGVRSDAEEDGTAVSAARELGRAIAAGIAPPFTGIRIKSLGESRAAGGQDARDLRAARCSRSAGVLCPAASSSRLPKVNCPDQPRTLVRWLERLEARHGLAPRSLRLEMMVETTQALIGADGRSPLPRLSRRVRRPVHRRPPRRVRLHCVVRNRRARTSRWRIRCASSRAT